MRVYKSWLKVSILAVLTVLILLLVAMQVSGGFNYPAGFNDLSISSIDSPVFTPPPASSPVSLGVEDDGKDIYVNKGDEVSFRFVEYGAGDSWKMRSNPNVKVLSDLVMESYPMQHALTVIMLAPTDIYFDRASAPGGGKTHLVYHITFYGNSVLTPGTNDSNYVPDPTFDIPPVIMDDSSFQWVSVPDLAFIGPLTNSNGASVNSLVKPAQGGFFDKVAWNIFDGKKLSGNLYS